MLIFSSEFLLDFDRSNEEVGFEFIGFQCGSGLRGEKLRLINAEHVSFLDIEMSNF
jgi:hypothetical protein